MKKKLKLIAIGIIVIAVIGLGIHYIYNNSFVPSEDVADKVIFEGLDASITVGESYGSVVKKVKTVAGSGNPKLIIAVETEIEELDRDNVLRDDMTAEEANAILKEQRKLFKEQQNKTSANMAGELELDYMNITYKYESYSPYIEAEFKGPLKRSDIADIYRIAKHPGVVGVVVQLEK